MIFNFFGILLLTQLSFGQDQVITESQVIQSTLKNFPLVLEAEMKFLAAGSE